jgi:cyclophilin family peptidyl-prolyl cis-trans isomerase/HEAT repeat protein
MRVRHVPAALLALLVLGGCLTFGAEPGPPKGTYRERLIGFARLLRMEDRRRYDPLLSGRTGSSPDPWLRAKTALAVSRLRDPDASVYLPVLLKDPEAIVRRAAAFGAGVTGDARLVRVLVDALGDGDAETAANAAEALGKIGGKDATDALVAALARREGPRAGAGLALFRKPEARTVTALLAAFGGEKKEEGPASDSDVRRAVVYALARKPQREAAPALRAVLGREEGKNESSREQIAWAARGLGILEDDESALDLVRLAASDSISISVQALGALNSLSKKIFVSPDDLLIRSAQAVALLRAKDPFPGIAISALRLLGALPDAPASRVVLEENLLRKGWRGQTALVALTRLDAPRDPSKAAGRLESAQGTGSLELRLGAAEALEVFTGDGPPERVASAASSDREPRVRAAALSSLSKSPISRRLAGLIAGLVDRDPSVRAVALEEAAPLVDGGSREFLDAWNDAYARSFAESEPDFLVAALDAAAARKTGGRELVEGHRDDALAIVREKARRLLVEKYGVAADTFRPIPVATRFSTADYDRAARAANEELVEAEVTTSRGVFRIQLLAEEAPLTVETFRQLASKRFFDGIAIHRVVPDFVVQTGDPRGDGSGGPGFAIRDEINPSRYTRGAVGMALSGADTGGSQWFVALSPQIHLDGGYTVFGRVVEGLDVLDRTEQDDRLVSFRVTARPRPDRPPGARP